MNLSSIVIQTKAEYLDEVLEAVKKSDFCEYHLHDDKGRIIVTIEGKDTDEEIRKLRVIEKIPHVISAEMVFAYSEDELEQERDKLEKADDNIPKWMNDPDAKAGDIKYGGDLKKRF
ncbi:MAG: nitrate reductase [Bacteroidetes bacterium 4484_276]|nr:MAG: nitrate reductase [Bacteroidetes bacterium 4484_276]